MVPDLKHVSVSFERQLDGYLSRRMQQLQFGLQRIRIILITRLPDIHFHNFTLMKEYICN